jgi:PilZ domain-containing protein
LEEIYTSVLSFPQPLFPISPPFFAKFLLPELIISVLCRSLNTEEKKVSSYFRKELCAMPQRRKHQRVEVKVPILCNIKTNDKTLLISSVGKVNNICLGGMRVQLPIELVPLKSRMVEYTLELPDPLTPLEGKGIIRWGYWDDASQESHFGMELCSLRDEQLATLESILIELVGDRESLYLTTMTN